MASRPRLVVFSDDWGRHPSSAQHLARELLGRYDVDWVNTVGTHRPRLAVADVRRGLGKLREWLAPRARAAGADPELPPGLRVHAPAHWPGFASGFERKLNRGLLLRALRDVLPGPEPPLAVVTTASITADLAAALPRLRWVYYCVDDLSEWPGLDARALREMELDLLPRASAIVAVSEHLRARLRDLGYESGLLTHGIELERWRAVRRRPFPAADAPPVAVYWGNADRRLDAGICLALARRARLVMVGPRSQVDARLLDAPGIEWRGAVPYDELPAIAAAADVLVMPYADLPVTRAMQPLKLKEYLATGLPVVATPLPANEEWRAAMDLARAPEAFVERVLARARAPLPAEQARARAALEHESWSAKAARFEQLALAPAREAAS